MNIQDGARPRDDKPGVAPSTRKDLHSVSLDLTSEGCGRYLPTPGTDDAAKVHAAFARRNPREFLERLTEEGLAASYQLSSREQIREVAIALGETAESVGLAMRDFKKFKIQDQDDILAIAREYLKANNLVVIEKFPNLGLSSEEHIVTLIREADAQGAPVQYPAILHSFSSFGLKDQKLMQDTLMSLNQLTMDIMRFWPKLGLSNPKHYSALYRRCLEEAPDAVVNAVQQGTMPAVRGVKLCKGLAQTALSRPLREITGEMHSAAQVSVCAGLATLAAGPLLESAGFIDGFIVVAQLAGALFTYIGAEAAIKQLPLVRLARFLNQGRDNQERPSQE